MNSYHITRTEHTTLGIRISVAQTDGTEIGHVYVFFITNDSHKKPYALVEDLCVLPEARSQGVGNTLLSDAIAIAREHECYKVLATSRTERDEVHTWYVRKGFEKFGYEFRMDLEHMTKGKEQKTIDT